MNINIEQTTIKSITDGRKNLLQALHESFGFDFEGNYKIYHITGKFTAKSLNKYAENDYFIVLTHYKYINTDILRAVGCDGETFDIDIKSSNYPTTETYRQYYTKSDFEDDRKNPYMDAYMITQADRKYGKYNSKAPFFDDCERFKILDNGSKYFRYMPYGFNGKCCPNMWSYNGDFDKSGYPVDLYRERLQEKAKKIREEREKAEYLKTDNSDKIATLERLINKYKKKLSEQILTVKTADDVRNLDHFICSWDGLSDIIDDFTNFKRNTEEKSFDSIKASNALYDHIAKCIYKYI